MMAFYFSVKLLTTVLFLITVVASQDGCWGSGFIRVQGNKFVDAQCQEYVFNGWNSWEMIETAAGVVSPSDWSQYGGTDPLSWMLDTAVSTNMCTLRLFGHGHDSGIIQLQYSPGSYNEQALQGLDKVLLEASKRGVKVVVTFADNWKDIDSKRKYVEWSSSAYYPDDFFFDEEAKTLFKNHIYYMANRVNSLTGSAYKDDPTILAWNLMNEPRCECDVGNQDFSCTPECSDGLGAWIEEMSRYTKEADPNHMVTVGEEGFFGWGSGKEWVNPDAWAGKNEWESWALKSGQNFARDHAPASIDFTGIHIWVDNWGLGDFAIDFFNKWIEEHMHESRVLYKPMVIEEFGKIVWSDYDTAHIRDPYFYAAYDWFINSLSGDDILKGAMWWEWQYDERQPTEEYDVKTYQTTWQSAIQPKSAEARQQLSQLPLVQNCVPGEDVSYEAVFGGSAYFVTKGPNLLAVDEGETLSLSVGQSMKGVSASQCALACDHLGAECQAFSFNSQQDGGSCYLKSSSSRNVGWSVEGWQTFWREEAVPGCNGDPYCSACSQDGVCISCQSGYLLVSTDQGQADCRSCNQFSYAVQAQRSECYWSSEE